MYLSHFQGETGAFLSAPSVLCLGLQPKGDASVSFKNYFFILHSDIGFLKARHVGSQS